MTGNTKTSTGVKTILVLLLTALPVAVIDQLTKVWTIRSLHFHEVKEIIPGFFNLVHARNPGVAFSLFAGFDERWVRPFLTIVTVLAIGGLLVASRSLSGKWYGRLGLGLVVGGAVGNLIDRVKLGYVIDFIDICLGRFHWPVFNIADIGITVGIFLLASDMIFENK